MICYQGLNQILANEHQYMAGAYTICNKIITLNRARLEHIDRLSFNAVLNDKLIT